MGKKHDETYASNLERYEKLVATNPTVDRKGATMPYTSLNGHMFSFLTKEGNLALRLPTQERELFLEKYGTKLCEQHGSVKKEYVEVPITLLRKTQELKKYFDISHARVGSLKPKPTKKKKVAKKKASKRREERCCRRTIRWSGPRYCPALLVRFCLQSVKPMKTRITLSVLLVSLVVLCLPVVGCSSREIQDEEKELLVTAGDLEVYGVAIGDPTGGESFLVKRNFDGSTEIEYEYDSEKDSSNADTLWLKSEAEILETVELASTAFDDRISAYKIGFFLGNSELELREDPGLFALGDESYSAYMEKGGSKLGNVLVIRKGNIVFSLLIVGLYFDDPQLLHDLMSPKLEKVDGIGEE